MSTQNRLHSLVLSSLLATVLTGCGQSSIPSPVTPTPDLGPLQTGAPGTLFDLAPGAFGFPLSLAPRKPALLMLSATETRGERLTVAVNPAGINTASSPNAYKTLGTTEADEVSASRPEFSNRLRRSDARLNGLKPRPGYRVQAIADAQVGDKRSYWVIADVDDSGSGSTDRQVTARAAYAGAHCTVMVDLRSGATLDARAREMGTTFDQQIHPTNGRLFGNPVAAAGHGSDKVTLLITPEVGNFGRDTTIGYFTTRDLFTQADAPDEPMLAHSNAQFMLYLSSSVVARGMPADYLGTVAHEYQHLNNASYKFYGPAAIPRTEATWLDEGLSMYAMQANGYGLDSDASVVFNHVKEYLAQPEAYSLTEWQLSKNQSAYGAVYLFTTFLVERAGEAFLSELVANPEPGLPKLKSLLAARGITFDALFKEWLAANLLDGTGLSKDPRYDFRTLNLMGTYRGRKLEGVTVGSLSVPSVGTLSLLPYSAKYMVLNSPTGGTFTLGLGGQGSQAIGGLLVTP